MKKVLVVDNNPDIRMVLRLMLMRRFDVEVTEAVSGKESIEFLWQTRFDLIISDFERPDGSGIWLYSFVRQSFPEIPMILFTCYPKEIPSPDKTLHATVDKYDFPRALREARNVGGLDARPTH